MRSDRAKVLHRLGGIPLVEWVRRAVHPLVDRVVAVVGHERQAVEAALAATGTRLVAQEPQRRAG